MPFASLLILNASAIYILLYKSRDLFESSPLSRPDIVWEFWWHVVWYAYELIIILSIFLSLSYFSSKKIINSLSLPNFLITVLVIYILITGLIFWFLTNILKFLQISSPTLEITWLINFIFIVAFFAILNTLYSIFFIK